MDSKTCQNAYDSQAADGEKLGVSLKVPILLQVGCNIDEILSAQPAIAVSCSHQGEVCPRLAEES